MKTIINVTSFIMVNVTITIGSRFWIFLALTDHLNERLGFPCEGSRCTRKWFVKTSFAETTVVGGRRRAESKVTRKMER